MSELSSNVLHETTELLRQLDTAVELQLQSYGIHHVLLGLSGGLDSMLLLQLLVRWQSRAVGRKLQAVYVHHGLSANADLWAEFCQKQCAELGVSLLVRHVRLSADSNIEAQARHLRYQVLTEQLAMFDSEQQAVSSHAANIVDPAIMAYATPSLAGSGMHSAVLTAHHADDQLETLLLALKRGSGPAGLAGIAHAKPCGVGWLLRPLLGFERSQLETAVAQLRLCWIDDESNVDSRFDRNFLRNEVLPLLKQRWGQFASTTSRSMQQLAQVQQLNDELLQQQLAQISVADGVMLNALQQYQAPTQILLLRLWLKKFGLNPPAERVNRILRELVQAKADAQPHITLGAFCLRRFAGQLYLLNSAQQQETMANSPSVQPLLSGEMVKLADGRCLLWQEQKADMAVEASYWPLAVSIEQPLQLGFGWLNYRFKPVAYPHSKPLKQWCKIWKVPPWQRGSMPSIIAGQQILLVVDHQAACDPDEALSWVSVTKLPTPTT